MGELINWMVALNNTNHVGFGLLTVGIMSGLGVVIGLSMEMVFKLFKVDTDKIDIQH
ncbi:MAG: hypothetical protein HQK91_08645 [Nitrospirae bacterium]|nr:hypothetical protein [Nitrospirota bacterium]